MAGYAPPRFSGSAHEDVDDFIKDFRLYLTAAGIVTNNPAGKQRAIANTLQRRSYGLKNYLIWPFPTFVIPV
jgi:hypothetical protein